MNIKIKNEIKNNCSYILWNGMRIYLHTTYFYQLRFLKSMGKDWLPVSICLWDPKWYNDMNFKDFVPKINSYNNEENDCEQCARIHKDDPMYDGNLECNYVKNYMNQLNNYNFNECVDKLINEVIKFYSKQLGEDIFLWKSIHILFVGYEVPNKKCSERFILSQWIKNNIINQYGDQYLSLITEWKYK